MDDIMVSICCQTYNHEKYIRKAFDGFIMQKTNFKFEVLIHDDASTDGTVGIIKEYEKRYPEIIKPIYQTENQYSKQVPVSYTYQYPRAKGKYVAFCEGDDYWIDETKLQKQVDFLEKHPQYIACVHKYIVVDENGEEQNHKTFGYYEKGGIYTFNDFFEKELPSQLATLVMRNILNDEKKGYPPKFADIGISGDIKLNLWLLIHGDIYRMDDVMSAYRFVVKKGGQSYSSRILSSPKNYINWQELCRLEKLLNEEYGLNVYFKNRRSYCAVGVIKDLKKGISYKSLKNVFVVLIKQRGTIKSFIDCLFDFVKRRLFASKE